MSRVLSDYLGAKEPAFTFALERLESLGGHPNADVRLQAEVERKTARKLRELGLDPKDSTPQEVYQALKSITKKHDDYLAKSMGAKDSTDVADLLPRIKAKAESLHLPRRVWAIKHSVAKRILKKHPPKNVMKQLGYKSVDSMLKREKIDELFLATKFLESKQWQSNLVKSYSSMNPSDFESRDATINIMTAQRWGEHASNHTVRQAHNIIDCTEIGSIGLLPLPIKHMAGFSITMLPLLIHRLNEVRLYSTFLKLQQVRPNFSEIFINSYNNSHTHIATMAGQPVSWRILQNYYGRNKDATLPEVFDPHVQLDDLLWKTADDVLYTIEPALKFWDDTNWIASANTKPVQIVSFNLLDNALNYCNNLSFAQRSIANFRLGLWNELMISYLGQESFTQQVLRQIDEALVDSADDIEDLVFEGAV